MSSEETVRTRPGLFRRTLRDHWAGIFLFGMLGTLVGIYEVYINFQPMYKAYSVLRAEPPSAALYGVNTSYETFEMFLKTQVQLLTSPNVLTAAGASPQVSNLFRVQSAHDVVQELKKVVDVDVKPGTTLIEVSMTSPDSDESAVIVNAVVKAYLETNEEWADGMTRTQIKRLEEYLRELHNQTDEIERRWKEIVSQRDVLGRLVAAKKRGESSAISIDQFKQLNDEIFRLQIDLVQAEAWLTSVKGDAQKAAEVKPGAGPEATLLDQKAQEADARVRELKVKQKALQTLAEQVQVDDQVQATDPIDIVLLTDQRASIKAMQEAVQRRLEQLRYESRGETRVRKVSEAIASKKPVSDPRLLYMAIVPFAVFFMTFDLFLVFEGARGPRVRPVGEPIVED